MMPENRWNEPRSTAERQPPGAEYGESRALGAVEVWREHGRFTFRVTTRVPGRTETERVSESLAHYETLDALLAAALAATGTNGVAWNFDVLRAAPTWDALPSGHIGQLGHAEADRLFDVVWIAA